MGTPLFEILKKFWAMPVARRSSQARDHPPTHTLTAAVTQVTAVTMLDP